MQAELRSGFTTGIEMLRRGLHLLSLLVSHEEWEVAPEVLSGLHPLDNFMNGTEQVISEGPDAYSSLVRAESKVATVARELHLSDVEDGVHLSGDLSGSDFVHENGRPGQVLLVHSHVGELFSLVGQVAGVTR